jgi:hypothetical protein
MDNEILNWIGNIINFLIIIYLVRATYITGCFNTQQTLITTIGLFIFILIQVYKKIK